MSGESSAAGRATLHDFVVEYVKVLAEVFGWRVVTAPGPKRGADAVIEHVVGGRRDAVLFVESEVGHDTGSAKEYFERLYKRHGELVKEYRDENVERIGIVIITNAPRRLSAYLKNNKREVCECLNLLWRNECVLEEGFNVFIVPAVMFKEVMPAVLVRFMGSPGYLA